MFTRIGKAFSAIAAAATVAAAITVLPGASDRVSASAPLNSGKGDRLDIRAASLKCAEQAWPYYDASCVKDPRQAMSRAQPARIVSADRIGR